MMTWPRYVAMAATSMVAGFLISAIFPYPDSVLISVMAGVVIGLFFCLALD